MRTLNTKEISDCVYRLARKAGVTLTPACHAALESAAAQETGAARFALETVLENERTAAREQMPVCQDTGMAVVLIELGQDVRLTGAPLKEAVDDGVRRAYADGCFRKSICDPLTRENTGDNTPAHLHLDMVAGENVRVTFLPKGFGSENMSRLVMLTPSQGRKGIVDTIVETVKIAGSRPCPPVCVGVGIGGAFDGCAFLAKKALTRDVGSANPREDVASIEREALEKINALNIGAQGFGGKVTALSVACEIAPTHIAGLPVAVNIQCHCVRCEKETL
ncbi:MAG TPA: fumarate hydratase [Firmicutes bacterium]|nr:fumarate hydratase [Bacillota bacterium]